MIFHTATVDKTFESSGAGDNEAVLNTICFIWWNGKDLFVSKK